MLKTQLSEFLALIESFDEEKSGETLLFQNPPLGSKDERFSVYAEGYGIRTKKGMEEIFQLLPRVLGEEVWNALGLSYVRETKSLNWNLNLIGASLPEYMKKNSWNEPWVELARFELELYRCFHAENKELEFSAGEFADINDESVFLFQAGTRLFQTRWKLYELWKISRENSLKPGDEFILIYQDAEGQATARLLPEGEYKVLSGLLIGQTLGEAIADIELTAEDLQCWLASWIEEVLFYKMK